MEEVFYYLKRHEKMVGIDIGWTSIKFLRLRNKEDGLSFQYEILDENLFDLPEDRIESVKQRIQEIAAMLSIQKNTPVYISFSHEVKTLDSREVQNIEELKKDYEILPFEVKNQLVAGEKKKIYFMANKEKINRILKLFKDCHIHIEAYTFSSLSLCGGLEASLNDDEHLDIMALLDIGANQTVCSVSAGHFIFSIKKFDFGANRWFELLKEKGKELGIDPSEIDQKYFENIPTDVTLQVFEACVPELKDYFKDLRDNKNLMPKKVIVSGGAARFPGIASYLSDALQIPTQVWGIRGAIHLKYSALGQKQFLDDEPALVTALGLLSNLVSMKRVNEERITFAPFAKIYEKLLSLAS